MIHRFVRDFGESLDLVFAWVVLIVAQPLIPRDTWLAQGDLAPWVALALSMVALLRARSFGRGPHPALRPANDNFGAAQRRLALVLVPWALLGAYQAGRLTVVPDRYPILQRFVDCPAAPFPAWYVPGPSAAVWAGAAVGLGLLVGLLLHLGRAHGQTPWLPPGRSGVWLWGPGVLLAMAGSAFFGLSASLLDVVAYAATSCPNLRSPALHLFALALGRVAISGFVGVSCVSLGLAGARAHQRRQRLAVGARGGGPYRPRTEDVLLAFLGPFLGSVLLLNFATIDFNALLVGDWLQVSADLDFAQAYVAGLHVLTWAAVVWPRRTPIARAVLFHEIVPTGIVDRAPGDAAAGFDQPPSGALRIHPLRVARNRVMFLSVVPVEDPRILDVDDPVGDLLWPVPKSPPQSHHILGRAVFAADASGAQSELVTVELERTQAVGAATELSRRAVVLRPFARGADRRATWWMEPRMARPAVQELDATTTHLTLGDGDILVLSAEGVGRAYEVELGEPLYDRHAVFASRFPQIPDYDRRTS